MKLTTIGIDLAKNVFQVHGADEAVPIKNVNQQAILIVHLAGHAAMGRN